MKLARLRLSNFRCFGPTPTELKLDDINFIIGPNGSGKTAILQALARMFSLDPAQRKIKFSDFYISTQEKPTDAPAMRELSLEADFEFPELSSHRSGDFLSAVPGNFAHMQMETDDQSILVRFRLHATIDQDGDIEEVFSNILKIDSDGSIKKESRVSKSDRNAIQVHYLPARRNPAEHISYSANALLGRILRAANWASEREAISNLTRQIAETLARNVALTEVDREVTKAWELLHKGKFYKNPSVSFVRDEIEALLRHLSLSFTPGPEAPIVDFSRLSDGQQSLLYISLVLATREISDKALAGSDALDIDKLRPPIFTLLAVEEPENSLSPHYLGRVVQALKSFGSGRDSQAVVATHAPSLLRRVDPEAIRYLRLDDQRHTIISQIAMPAKGEAEKYVRQAVQAFPELYFARFVLLGEGDSEEIVLPKLLDVKGMLADDSSISVVPLGGRHVNHFWRLLTQLGIPHATLLDLDLARSQGGWGRIRYAAQQLLNYGVDDQLDQDTVDSIASWNDNYRLLENGQDWIEYLESYGVFFSLPLDLDFMMIETFPVAYDIGASELAPPDADTAKAVLGKKHDIFTDQYTSSQQELFDAYHRRFKLGSKPSHHVNALSKIDDAALFTMMPGVLSRLLTFVEKRLEELPE